MRARMTLTKNFEVQHFFNYPSKFFWKLLLFMFHTTLIIMKIFFRFSKSATTLWYTILDSRFPPWSWNAILEARPPLCNASSEAEALDTGGTYREWLGRKFSKSNFFKVFLKTTFLHDSCYPDHFEPKIFLFELVKNENFEYVINENCPLCITKIGKN